VAERPPVDDTSTTTPTQNTTGGPLCPVCWAPFQPVGRQRFCTDACRKTAWARTHRQPRPLIAVPPPGQRLEATVYACPQCQQRYAGQQWCPDCHTPCTRVGLGGHCPHCDQPVTLTELLDTLQEAPRPLT